MRLNRATFKEVALTLALLVGAVLLGAHFRTPAPQPADYCTNGNHVTITTDRAQTILNGLRAR